MGTRLNKNKRKEILIVSEIFIDSMWGDIWRSWLPEIKKVLQEIDRFLKSIEKIDQRVLWLLEWDSLLKKILSFRSNAGWKTPNQIIDVISWESDPKGKTPYKCLHNLVIGLLRIYERTTGKEVKQHYDPYPEKSHPRTFHSFLCEICLKMPAS